MAVRLRLMRLGRKGQPFYRIVAVDSRKRRDGAYIEKIGHYNPLKNPAEVVFDDKKALKWLRYGALPSDTVRSLLSRKGILLTLDLQKRGLDEAAISEQVARFCLDKEAKLRPPEPIALQAEPTTEAAPAVTEPKVEIEPVENPTTEAEQPDNSA
ncbi:MAG: 30S ribosomal protein S16 [bacterium]